MGKRGIEAFGGDKESHSAGAVTSGKIGKFGKQKDAKPSKSDEQKSRQHRSVRAWGYLPRYQEGGLQQDHSRGGMQSRQAVAESSHSDGGNSVGKTTRAVDPHFVDNFQGRSGEPDNQSIHRGKGST